MAHSESLLWSIKPQLRVKYFQSAQLGILRCGTRTSRSEYIIYSREDSKLPHDAKKRMVTKLGNRESTGPDRRMIDYSVQGEQYFMQWKCGHIMPSVLQVPNSRVALHQS